MTMHEPVRILYVIDKLSPGGGAAVHLAEVVKNLDRRQYAVAVSALGGLGEGPEVERMRETGAELRFWSVDRIYGPDALPRFVRLVRYIRAGRFDVVHTYLFSAGVFAGLAAWLARTRVILSSTRELVEWKRPRHVLASRVVNALCRRIVVPSHATKASVLAVERPPADKVVVIHNGVDLERCDARRLDRAETRSRLGLGPERFVITTVARFAPIKDHATLLRAAQIAVRRDPAACLLLVGDGPQLQPSRDLAARLGIDGNVVFAGAQGDVWPYLCAADAYVCSSLSEAFSNAILEAMAMSRAVIATAAGGNPETVADGESGLLVDPGDPQALAAAMIALMDDRQRCREMGRRGRALVEEKFSSATMAAGFDRLYRELLAPRPAPDGTA
jgi:glycosyltransferase involved in cell wall biosynthesis